jgi:hypothetical protein
MASTVGELGLQAREELLRERRGLAEPLQFGKDAFLMDNGAVELRNLAVQGHDVVRAQEHLKSPSHARFNGH